MKSSLLREWLVISLALLIGVFWLADSTQLQRANLWLQDLSVQLQKNQASQDVTLVLLDERSLAAIGRWPWRRALHALLIDHISAGHPQSIGLDFLLPEPDLDYPEDDYVLAQSLQRSGRVVLPVVQGFSGQGADLPLPLFANAAARLGHVHLPLDDDGGVRSFYALEGPGNTQWLQLGLSMLCVSDPQRADCQTTNHKIPIAPKNWERNQLTHIAFASGSSPFTMYSYIDVLRGYIPASAFRNKHVLIGRAAAGLDTTIATPSGSDQKSSHTIELIAHITSGALQNQHTVSASPWANRLFNLIPVALGLAALTFLGPSTAFFACISLAALTVLASLFAPSATHVLFSPAAALLALVLAYPIWSWRRLNTATEFLGQELKSLSIEGLHPHSSKGQRWDFLQRRIDAVEQATKRLHQLHQFITQIMLQLPSPTLACRKDGTILLANSAAEAYAKSLHRDLHSIHSIADLLDGAIERDSLNPLWNPTAPPPLDQVHQCEGIDLQKNSLLMLSRPFAIVDEMGWLVSLVDISDLREVIAQRDQAMHFISHDIRAPIGAILTVIEMEQHAGKVDTNSVLLQRIQRYARNSLALADDFVHLARAQNAIPQRLPVELGAIIDQALDDMWAVAKERYVELEWMPQEEEAWVLGDPSMLRRSCANLISNAIKYGPVEGTVHCSLTHDEGYWCINIRDEGEGISRAEQERLFAPYKRQSHHERSPIKGVGLGLAYVDAVAKQHGGSISVTSKVGYGACFTLRLPAIATPEKNQPSVF